MKNKKKNADLNASRSIKKDADLINFNLGKLKCWCHVDFKTLIPEKVEFNYSFSCCDGKPTSRENVAPEDIELLKVSYLRKTELFLIDNAESMGNTLPGLAEELENIAFILNNISLRLLEQYACKKGIRLEENKCSH